MVLIYWARLGTQARIVEVEGKKGSSGYGWRGRECTALLPQLAVKSALQRCLYFKRPYLCDTDE
jgi:hypothetical protein